MNQIIKSILCVAAIMLITSCGFKLRGSQALPESLTDVAINAPIQYSPFSRTLKERLPVYQLKGEYVNSKSQVDMDFDSTVYVELTPENLERRLLSIFSTGQVAEYELIYTMNYTVIFPDREPISQTLKVSREYQEDPDRILAKARELDTVIQEMRDEVADRLIRLLASQYSASVLTNN